MVSKPTLFLSHAAKDARPLGLLRERLLAIMGNTIEIFQSSDGQSIPFGRNWIHEVEEALNRAKLMYVFLSPAALESKWVLFEAGYVYSKKIQVVPVGILGVDLARIGPPLGFLQGFNITSGSAMNNLLTIINRTFTYSFDEVFNDSDYKRIFLSEQVRSTSLFGRYSEVVSDIILPTTCIYAPESGEVPRFLEQQGVNFFMKERTLYCHGMSFPLHKGHVDINVDPLLSAITFPILEKLVPYMQGDSFDNKFTLRLALGSPIRAVDGIHRLSARIFGSDLLLSDNGGIALDALCLKLHQGYERVGAVIQPAGVEINAQYKSSNLTDAPLEKALSILFDVGALYFDSQGAG